MSKIEKAYAITDAKISFVSLVDKAANKKQFLITKAEHGSASFASYGRIVNADADSHYITGIVYEPLTEDAHGNYMTEQEITKAAYWFAKNGIKFNTLCFPVTDDTLQTAVRTKIKYMRESMGKGVNAVLPDAKSPDHEGIINVTNSVVVDGVELTHAEACAFVAGITASAARKEQRGAANLHL